MYNKAEIIEVLVDYLSEHVMPTLPSQNMRIIAGALPIMVGLKYEDILQNVQEIPWISMLGVIQGDLIDMDSLITALRTSVFKNGSLEFTALGRHSFKFGVHDFDALATAFKEVKNAQRDHK